MAVILIDVDYVILDLESKWLALYNRDYNDNVQVSHITEWAIHKFVKPECGLKIYDYLDLPDLYDDVEVVDGAIEAINELRKIGHECYFLSAGIHKGKYLRLKHYGLVTSEDDYICAKNKRLFNKVGNYLVDDGHHNVIAFGKGGILFDAPHNHQLNWYNRAKNWTQVIMLINYYERESAEERFKFLFKLPPIYGADTY